MCQILVISSKGDLTAIKLHLEAGNDALLNLFW